MQPFFNILALEADGAPDLQMRDSVHNKPISESSILSTAAIERLHQPSAEVLGRGGCCINRAFRDVRVGWVQRIRVYPNNPVFAQKGASLGLGHWAKSGFYFGLVKFQGANLANTRTGFFPYIAIGFDWFNKISIFMKHLVKTGWL